MDEIAERRPEGNQSKTGQCSSPKKTQEWIEWICQFKLAFQHHHSHLYEVTTNHLSIIYNKLSLIIRQITYQYW